MSIHVVNHGIIKCISIHTTLIRPMIKYDVDKPQNCFQQDIKWMQAMRLQLSTISELDLDCVHHLPYRLLPDKDTYCLPAGNE
jgi:hypothetical protein